MCGRFEYLIKELEAHNIIYYTTPLTMSVCDL